MWARLTVDGPGRASGLRVGPRPTRNAGLGSGKRPGVPGARTPSSVPFACFGGLCPIGGSSAPSGPSRGCLGGLFGDRLQVAGPASGPAAVWCATLQHSGHAVDPDAPAPVRGSGMWRKWPVVPPGQKWTRMGAPAAVAGWPGRAIGWLTGSGGRSPGRFRVTVKTRGSYTDSGARSHQTHFRQRWCRLFTR